MITCHLPTLLHSSWPHTFPRHYTPHCSPISVVLASRLKFPRKMSHLLAQITTHDVLHYSLRQRPNLPCELHSLYLSLVQSSPMNSSSRHTHLPAPYSIPLLAIHLAIIPPTMYSHPLRLYSLPQCTPVLGMITSLLYSTPPRHTPFLAIMPPTRYSSLCCTHFPN